MIAKCHEACDQVLKVSRKHMEIPNCVFSSVVIALILRNNRIKCGVYGGYIIVDNEIVLRHSWIGVYGGGDRKMILETNPMISADFKTGNVRYEYQTSEAEHSQDSSVTDTLIHSGLNENSSHVITYYDNVINMARLIIKGTGAVLQELGLA